MIEVAPSVWLLSPSGGDCLFPLHALLHAASNWRDASVFTKAGEKVVRSDVRCCGTLSGPELSQARTLLQELFSDVTGLVAELAEPGLNPSPINIVRYKRNGFFRDHTDQSPTAQRVYSVVVYLNDAYSGGATVFPRLRIQLKPNPGEAIVFPSSELHSGARVTMGVKYIATTWFLRGEISRSAGMSAL